MFLERPERLAVQRELPGEMGLEASSGLGFCISDARRFRPSGKGLFKTELTKEMDVKS